MNGLFGTNQLYVSDKLSVIVQIAPVSPSLAERKETRRRAEAAEEIQSGKRIMVKFKSIR